VYANINRKKKNEEADIFPKKREAKNKKYFITFQLVLSDLEHKN